MNTPKYTVTQIHTFTYTYICICTYIYTYTRTCVCVSLYLRRHEERNFTQSNKHSMNIVWLSELILMLDDDTIFQGRRTVDPNLKLCSCETHLFTHALTSDLNSGTAQELYVTFCVHIS